MNLAEEFTLLAYADDGSLETDSMRLDNGLGGAVLLELALAGRVDVEDKRVVVLDPAPTGDPLIDAALAEVVAAKAKRADHWVQRFAKGTRGRVLDKLVADGVLRREEGKVLLVFPRTRFVAAHGVEPVAETEVRQRLRGAVAASGAVEKRTAAMCALVAATGLERKVFADLDRKQVKARLKEISAGDWAASAVKKSIEAIEAAIMVAIIAATTASTSAATSGS
jgi:hypothetical protein